MSISYFDTDIIELYFNSNIVKSAYSSFKKELKSNVQIESFDNINHLNNEIFKLISDLQLEKLFVSLTESNSIFYRFSKQGGLCEFKFELFFDYNENDPSDVESILHMYENGVKKGSYYGTIEEMYNLITKTYGVTESPQGSIEYIYQSPEAVVKQYTPELGLSYALNPQATFPIN